MIINKKGLLDAKEPPDVFVKIPVHDTGLTILHVHISHEISYL